MNSRILPWLVGLACGGLLLAAAGPSGAIEPAEEPPPVDAEVVCVPLDLCDGAWWPDDDGSTIELDLRGLDEVVGVRFVVEANPRGFEGEHAFAVTDAFGDRRGSPGAEVVLHANGIVRVLERGPGSEADRRVDSVNVGGAAGAGFSLDIYDRELVLDYGSGQIRERGGQLFHLDPDDRPVLHIGVNASPSGSNVGEGLEYLEVRLLTEADVLMRSSDLEGRDDAHSRSVDDERGPTRIDGQTSGDAGGPSRRTVVAILVLGALVAMCLAAVVQLAQRRGGSGS